MTGGGEEKRRLWLQQTGSAGIAPARGAMLFWNLPLRLSLDGSFIFRHVKRHMHSRGRPSAMQEPQYRGPSLSSWGFLGLVLTPPVICSTNLWLAFITGQAHGALSASDTNPNLVPALNKLTFSQGVGEECVLTKNNNS